MYAVVSRSKGAAGGEAGFATHDRDCEKGFRSWIRLKDNHIEQEVKFPESFLKPRK